MPQQERPPLMWTPSPELVSESTAGKLLRDRGLTSYEELWAWSVDHLDEFWSWLWRHLEVSADGDPSTVLASSDMPGARWFPEVALSFPEHLFRKKDPEAIAVYHASELREAGQWTWARLREETAKIQAGLRALGVERGDRVAAFLPNIPETLAAFIAVTGLGAIWSCCSPDFGGKSVVDRFAQVTPKVLLAVDGYRYGGREFERSATVWEILSEVRSIEHHVRFGYLDRTFEWDLPYSDAPGAVVFERVPFNHPLCILYSSGTTGTPKPIVHGHGGLLLEHAKFWDVQHDVRAGDRVFWFTTTGWVVWNILVGALLQPASIVLFDGSPGHPDLTTLWDLADAVDVTFFGASAAFLHGCMKTGVRPRGGRKLDALRAIGSTGSPLAPEAFEWVRDELGDDIWLSSSSGGTDIASAFVGGSPLSPVRRGELPARLLGVAVEAWDDDGLPVIDEVGELVVTKPMPSMPVAFWGASGDERYRDAYFATYPGVWRHGDWIKITAEGSAVIYGRSDATINRGGIRIGTAEIYSAALSSDLLNDALVVDTPDPSGVGEGSMTMFVQLSPGNELTEAITADVRGRIRSQCSPRHVPDTFVVAPDLPRTLTGKLLEIPVKRLLMGHPADGLADVEALANPAAWHWFIEYAETSRRPVGATTQE